jgi:hypothetical protein
MRSSFHTFAQSSHSARLSLSSSARSVMAIEAAVLPLLSKALAAREPTRLAL